VSYVLNIKLMFTTWIHTTDSFVASASAVCIGHIRPWCFTIWPQGPPRTRFVHRNSHIDKLNKTNNHKTFRVHVTKFLQRHGISIRPTISSVITVRRSALHGLCDRNSVRLSVCLSFTLVHCVHMVRPAIMISSPYGSPIILVSEDITFIPKFGGGHPERGR